MVLISMRILRVRTSFLQQLKGYIKKYWVVLLSTLAFYLLTFIFWKSFLEHGAIHDGKHGLTFIGEAAYGHLVGSALGAIVFTCYFLKTLKGYCRKP